MRRVRIRMIQRSIHMLLGMLMCAGIFMTNVSVACAGDSSSVQNKQNPNTGYQVVLEDDANLLTEAQESNLIAVMEDITAYGNVAFHSIDYNSGTTEGYAKSYYRSLFGTKSGTLFLIDMDNRNIWIFSDGAVYKVISKAYANTITDNVYRYASDGEYYECSAEAFKQIFTLLEGDRIAQPMKYISNALLAMILALLINFGVVCYFTKARKTGEDEILKKVEKRFSCTVPEATFLHQTKTYDPVSSDSGGSSGGGGSSSGGSSGGGGGHSF